MKTHYLSYAFRRIEKLIDALAIRNSERTFKFELIPSRLVRYDDQYVLTPELGMHICLYSSSQKKEYLWGELSLNDLLQSTIGTFAPTQRVVVTSFVAKLQVRGAARIQAVTYAVEYSENTEKQFMRQLERPLRGRPKVLVDVGQSTDFEFGDIAPDGSFSP